MTIFKNKQKFIDLHCHALCGVDDGAVDLEDSINLLKKARDDNIKKIILTPHCSRYGDYRCQKEIYLKKIHLLKKELQARDIEIDVCIGNEILLDDKVMQLIEDKKACSLNNSRYILFELPFDYCPNCLDDEIYDIIAAGYIPILAHPERYSYFWGNENILYELCMKGCLLQVNRSSILKLHGRYSYRCAMKLLKHNLVHFVASDGHNESRTIKLSDAYDYLSLRINSKYLNKLFYENPLKVIENKKIVIDFDKYQRFNCHFYNFIKLRGYLK